MSFIKRICSFFKKVFNKKDDIKMIEQPIKKDLSEEKNKFIDSIKINIVKNKKRKVETLTCFGDGLGIQTKISY